MKDKTPFIVGGVIFLLVLVFGYAFISTNRSSLKVDRLSPATGLMEDNDDNEESQMKKAVEDPMPEGQAEIGYIDITPRQANDLIDQTPDLVIIDVSSEYESGHLPGAVNYYVGDGSLDEAIPTLDKSKTYLVYCHVDSASIAGAEKLVQAGFPNVYRLEGNYPAWVKAGYPVEK